MDLTSIGAGSGGRDGTGDDWWTHVCDTPSRTRSSWKRFGGRVAAG